MDNRSKLDNGFWSWRLGFRAIVVSEMEEWTRNKIKRVAVQIDVPNVVFLYGELDKTGF